ncbi:hypothetical protein [Fuchsiella alkaliacetigena]|uniref:hypothetical protein n=1 Tax=Fuchsiella alkaliacetigena TaxID=957042 RepID=UPI00200A590E|nr:hypothetical protein [Fuchsiella alkaliacetigena]MCK8824320.1 hypothetical protein [Fuchsiella alkaliacetigena]
MNFIRKIIDSDSLDSIVDLPPELKNRRVEVIVLPVEEDNSQANKSLRGILNKYADSELRKKEKGAWQMRVAENYEDH